MDGFDDFHFQKLVHKYLSLYAHEMNERMKTEMQRSFVVLRASFIIKKIFLSLVFVTW